MNDTSNMMNIDKACRYLRDVAKKVYCANRISWAFADDDTARAIKSLLAHYENVKAELEELRLEKSRIETDADARGHKDGLAAGKRDTEIRKEAYARGVKEGYEACMRGLNSDMIEVLTPELVEALKS